MVQVALCFLDKRDLTVGTALQFAEKRIAYRRGIEPRRAEFIEEDVTLLEGEQAGLPFLGNRAFLGQQRPRAELKSDRRHIRVFDPVCPVAHIPYAAGHNDRHGIQAQIVHDLAQLRHTRARIFRNIRVFTVRQPVMATGTPRIFIDHAAEPFGELVIRSFPQRAKRPGRRDNRVIIDAVFG